MIRSRLSAALLLALALGAAAPMPGLHGPALAKDSGGDNSGPGGGDDGGRGGGDNSGHGSGRDDRDRDDDDDDRRGRDDDHGRYGGSGAWQSGSRNAREAVAGGRALPLSAVLPAVRAAVPGRILDVDLLQSPSGTWVYQLVVLTADRKYREVTVDAHTRRILQLRYR